MASLNFSLANIYSDVGQSNFVDIYLDSPSESVGGVDVIIKFDPSSIRIDNLHKATAFNDYPAVIINQNDGSAQISGIANSPQTFITGKHLVATVEFTPLTSGNHTLRFDYTPGKTNDSNIAVLSGIGDSLNEVNQLTIVTSNLESQNTSISPTPQIKSDNPIVFQKLQGANTAQSNPLTNSATTNNKDSATTQQDSADAVYHDLPVDPLSPLENPQTIYRSSTTQPTTGPGVNTQQEKTTAKSYNYLIIISFFVIAAISILYAYLRYKKGSAPNINKAPITPTKTQAPTKFMPPISNQELSNNSISETEPKPPQTPISQI